MQILCQAEVTVFAVSASRLFSHDLVFQTLSIVFTLLRNFEGLGLYLVASSGHLRVDTQLMLLWREAFLCRGGDTFCGLREFASI